MRIGNVLRASWILVASLVVATPALSAQLGAGQLRAIREATFEVVVPKATTDPLSYERPLPLELVPFEQRNDAYFPVGTAFALGDGRFATAAHVLGLTLGYPYGKPALRDAQGRVFPLSRVLRYAGDRDFAVVQVDAAPRARPLPINRKIELDVPTFAVGNALGEGIVVRDGLLTSSTAEPREGRWQWLRFSAAASPGNSGGPLLDERGRVIGLIVAASPNENLNFALPIGEVLDAADGMARLAGRVPFGLPLMPQSITIDFDRTLPLPATYAEFEQALLQFVRDEGRARRARFLREHAEQIFPAGVASERLLRTFRYMPEPRLIAMGADRRWELQAPIDEVTVQLGSDGRVRHWGVAGAQMAKIERPRDVPLASLLRDSKVFMDLLLEGLELFRDVGPERVRVTSLGPAQLESTYADRWGRKWQVRSWPLAFVDLWVVAVTLPQPDGVVALARLATSADAATARDDLALLTDFVHTGYRARLEDWPSFLAEKDLLPAAFEAVSFEFVPDKRLQLQTRNFELAMDAQHFSLDPRTRLLLQYGFLRRGDGFAWDSTGLTLLEPQDTPAAITVSRLQPPAADADEAAQDDWRNAVARRHPYTGSPSLRDGFRRLAGLVPVSAERTLPPGAEPSVLYRLDFASGAYMSEREIREAHQAMLGGFRVRE